MGRRRRKLPVLENIEIIDFASEGKSIAKVEDKVIFVQNCIPGDVVDLQVSKKRKKYLEAYPINFIKHSPIKIEHKCEHFNTCGGCKWQSLPYERQLFYKEKQVYDTLKHLGGFDPETYKKNPIVGSDEIYFYRNKLEYTFSNKRWLTKEEIESEETIERENALGFHIPKMFDKILDIKNCYLQPEPSNSIRLAVKQYALENDLTFFDIKMQEGFLRNLIIRTSSTGDVMVILSLFHEDKENRIKLLDFLKNKFPEITSLQYVINPKGNDTISDLDIVCYHGEDHIFEEMEGLRFKISPKSFYQTNSKQAYKLYSETRKLAGLKDTDKVYDLYTGTGTIANFVAKHCQSVVGVEYVEDAITDAKLNSDINNLNNTKFYAGDMKDVLNQEFINKHGVPDVMIIDPPRAGMHADVVETILKASPVKIVYVSCNPATQARDIKLMSEKYNLLEVQPVDMFPHTHHVENIVLLELKK